MTGFEPQTSGMGSNLSANRATKLPIHEMKTNCTLKLSLNPLKYNQIWFKPSAGS